MNRTKGFLNLNRHKYSRTVKRLSKTGSEGPKPRGRIKPASIKPASHQTGKEIHNNGA